MRQAENEAEEANNEAEEADNKGKRDGKIQN